MIPRMTSAIIIASGHLSPRLTELTEFLLAATPGDQLSAQAETERSALTERTNSENIVKGAQLACTYSEIVWLGAGLTAPTWANANRTTGLPSSYE